MSAQQEEIPLEEITYTPKTKESTTLKPESISTKTISFLYLTAAVANLLSFTTGSSITWVSPFISKATTLSDDNPFGRALTYREVSWIAGLLPLGATVGPLVAGKIGDKLGRKPTLLILACGYSLSFLIPAFAKIVPLFCLSRFLAGVSLGSTFAVLPMYMVEISETHNRGALGCSVNIFVACGVNFSLIVGPYLSIQHFSLTCLCPLLIFIPSFFLFSPESPPFLASANDDKILTSLIKLRNKTLDEIQLEAARIIESVQQNREAKGGIRDVVKVKSCRKGLIICLGIIIFQQLGGISAVLSYMPTIFESAKVNLPPEVCAMMVGSFQILGTVISTVTVDRAGRKFLLLGSTLGSWASLTALGLYFYLKNSKYQVDSISWLPVASLVVFIVSFSVGLGSVPWVVVSEIFPSNVRSTAASLTSVTCFLVTFLVTVTFPSLALHFGMAKCFFIFSSICMAGTLFIFWMLPETKGKSLQEIQKLLGGK